MIEHDFSPEQRAELGDLNGLLAQLKRYDIAKPDSARLLAVLTPLLNEQPERDAEISLEAQSQGVYEWLQFAWAQTALLETPFWAASTLLIVLGMMLGMSFGGAVLTLCLVLGSPVLAVLGVAYLFRPATRALRELEQLSHVHPLQFLYARLALILTLNLGFTMALLLLAWTQGLQIVLWRLLLIWFGPMIGLTGLALFCSVRWNSVVGIAAPLVVWGSLVFAGWRDVVLNTTLSISYEAVLMLRLSTSNILLGLAVALLAVGLLLMVESGRWVAKWF